ncbi:MAG: hypothetical protein KAI26_02605, partial [Nanoarchaeota archaeon]|nr:hypothetical protein [Nanoarchaeota archaeon]
KTNAPDGLTEIVEKWRFECKRYGKGVSFDNISGKIQAANLNKIDKIVIMSNMHLTPQCQDEIEKIGTTTYPKILNWTGLHFQNILFRHPNIFEDFFPDEEIPLRILDVKRPEEIIKIPKEIGKTFGIDISLNTNKVKFDSNEPEESLCTIIKENIQEFEKLDVNIQSLLYQQFASLFQLFNKKDDAIFFINKSLKITPKNISALLLKAFIFERFGDLDESNKCCDEVLEIDKENKFALNNKAHNLRRKGRFDDALKLVEEALKQDSNFIVAINNKASILKASKKISEGVTYLEEKIKLFPDSNILSVTLVNLYTEDLDLKKAFDLNKKILLNDPLNIDAINNKGVICERNSRFISNDSETFNNLAQECFEKTIELDKNFALGWSNKSICMQNKGEVDEAERFLEDIFKLFPLNSFVLKNKGLIALRKEDPKGALKFFNKSLKYNYDIPTLINKADSLLQLSKHKEVLDVTKKILDIDDHEPPAWKLRGLALRKLHQPTKAEVCFNNEKKYVKQIKSTLKLKEVLG